MVRTQNPWTCLFLALCLNAAAAQSQPSAKKKVVNQSDLPRFSYPVNGSATTLLQADAATFGPFAAKVGADLDTIFRDYEVEDKATLKNLIYAKMELQLFAGNYAAARETLKSYRSLLEKPASKLTDGLITSCVLQSASDSSLNSPAYKAAFSQCLHHAVDSLPWEVVGDSIRGQLGFCRTVTAATVIAWVKTDLDPAAAKSGGLNSEEAWDLLNARRHLQYTVPVKEQCADVMGAYVAAHNVQKPDIWREWEVTLTTSQKLTPVLIGIWDTGVDVSLFPGQVFDDSHPTASGNHGLAFDDFGNPSAAWLYPLTPAQEQDYPAFRQDLKGYLDLENNIDSPEAVALQKKLSTFTPEQLHQQAELRKVLGFYIHGTHVSGIAVRGNPAARLVVARFNDNLPDLTFAPTTEWANRLSADFQQMSNYFGTRNVRVVNMSWSDEPQEFELWLSKTGGGTDPVERKRRAQELYTIWHEAVENALRNAPDTLFVCAAGNADSDASFQQSVPAGLQLPNLISVGAVNQAGDETAFTSYGKTVVVDANGYEVESSVPGGEKMKLSGTSMASPNVANLAAKLFALDPNLTPQQVIDLIRKTSTTTEDGRRHLINPKAAVASLASAQPGR